MMKENESDEYAGRSFLYETFRITRDPNEQISALLLGEECFNTLTLLSFKYDSDCILLSFKLILLQNEKGKTMKSIPLANFRQTLGTFTFVR